MPHYREQQGLLKPLRLRLTCEWVSRWHLEARCDASAAQRHPRSAPRGARNLRDGEGTCRCSSLADAGFLTSAVARAKARPTDRPGPTAWRTRLLRVDCSK